MPDTAETAHTHREIAAIYRQHAPRLRTRCQRILHDVTLAEDALQQTFVRLLTYWASYDRSPSKAFWLLRACDQVCLNMLRKRRRGRRVEGQVFDEQQHSNESDVEQRDYVDTFLQRLSGQECRLALCSYRAGMSQVEIARVTGWSRQTVHKKLSRIRRRAARFSCAAAAEALLS